VDRGAKLREATEPLVRDLQATLAWDQARARSEVDWWLRLAVDGLGLRSGRAIRSSRLTTRSSSRPWWSEPLKPSRSGRMRRSSIRRGRRASATGAIRCRLARRRRQPCVAPPPGRGGDGWAQDARRSGRNRPSGSRRTPDPLAGGPPTNAGPDPAVLLIASTPRPLPSQLVISARPGRAAGARPSAPGAPGRATRG
jgi:hypothetical protein